MTRFDAERLDDIDAAIAAIDSHVSRGTLDDGLVLDAVRIRILEIGEAVKALSLELTTTEADIPWSQIARMRDRLAHHYFVSSREIIQSTIDNDLAPLRDAVARMRSTLDG